MSILLVKAVAPNVPNISNLHMQEGVEYQDQVTVSPRKE